MDTPPRRRPRFAPERSECRFYGNAATKPAISAIMPATFRARTHRMPILWKRGRGMPHLPAFLAQVCSVLGTGLRTFWRESAETLQTCATGSSVRPIPGTGMRHSSRPAPPTPQTGRVHGAGLPPPACPLSPPKSKANETFCVRNFISNGYK